MKIDELVDARMHTCMNSRPTISFVPAVESVFFFQRYICSKKVFIHKTLYPENND